MYGSRRPVSRDPFWIDRSKYAGHCARCNAAINRGDRIFYYPNSHSTFCAADGCGEQASRDFRAMAQDEAFLSGRGY